GRSSGRGYPATPSGDPWSPGVNERARKPLEPLTPSPYASVVYSVSGPAQRLVPSNLSNRRAPLGSAGPVRWPRGSRLVVSVPVLGRPRPPSDPAGRLGPRRNLARAPRPCQTFAIR